MTSPLPGHPEFGRTGTLPRAITPDCLWTGRCLASSVPEMHAHYALYLLKGSAKTVLIDTGHPIHWAEVKRDVDAFLGGCSTSGLMRQPGWLEKRRISGSS